MKKLYFILLLFSISFLNAQCNNCAKNFGGWTDDYMIDMQKTTNGFLYAYEQHFYQGTKLIKYNFNCTEEWSKTTNIQAFTSDSNGNIYTLGTSGYYQNYTTKLTKLNSNGVLIWEKQFTGQIGRLAKNVFIKDDRVYVTGLYWYNIQFENNLTFQYPFQHFGSNAPKAFIAKYDVNGNFIDANQYGNGITDLYKDSEIDSDGYIYFTKVNNNYYQSVIEKINGNLQVVLSKEISNNNGVSQSYVVSRLHFNKLNSKLYMFGSYNGTTKIDNVIFTSGLPALSINNQSIVSEFNTSDLTLSRYVKFDSNSYLEIPAETNSNTYSLNSGYFAENNDNLFVFSSFHGSLALNNITSTSTNNPGGFNSEDLILFKINLNTFIPEKVFQSTSVTPIYHSYSLNAANSIFLNNSDLYVSSNFSGKPIELNNVVINNNSGNNNFDVLLYKHNLDNQNSISSNSPSCANSQIQLFASGGISYSWTGPNGFTSSLQNPIIQNASILNSGSYSCTITSGNNCAGTYTTIVIVGDNLPPVPNISNLPDITGNCQTMVNTIPTATDNCAGTITATTSNPLNYSQAGTYVITWTFNDGNGNTTTQTQNVIIVAQSAPTGNATQNFCLINAPTLSNITITGSGIKWYNTAGNLLPNNTPLVNGTTYFATQTVNGCESLQTPITVTINDPNPPTGNPTATFCPSQNPTIASLTVNGQNIKWYNAAGILLPAATVLVNGQTYFATQTINGCESSIRFAVAVTISNDVVPANNYITSFCNPIVGNSTVINLSNYNGNIIANPTAFVFEYYDAANQIITNFTNVNLVLGLNQFKVKVINSNGCFKLVNLNVTLHQKPTLNVSNVEFCKGNSAILDAGSGFASYLWSTGETSQTINVTQPGNYNITVTNAIGCSNTAQIIVTQTVAGTITGIEISNNAATILVSPSGNYLYSLDGINFQNSNIFDNLGNGSFTAFVKTNSGCEIPSLDFTIFNIQNVVTPNNDGYNDVWTISGLENYRNSKVTVVDRFGKTVFEKTNAKEVKWDCTYLGRPLPTSTYWYILKVSDGRVYKGFLMIKNRY